MKAGDENQAQGVIHELRESWRAVIEIFRDDGQDFRRKVGVGFCLMIGGVFASSGLPIIAARLMGPSEYGAFAFLQGVIGLLCILAFLGINNYAIKAFPLLVESRELRQIWKTVLMGIAISIPVTIFFASVFYFTSQILKDYVSFTQFAVLSFIVVFVYFFSFCLQGVGSRLFGSISRGPIVTVSFTIMALYYSKWFGSDALSTYKIIWPMVFLYVLLLMFMISYFRRTIVKAVHVGNQAINSHDSIVGILRTSLPMLAFASSFFLMAQTDVIMLGYFASEDDVATYIFSSRLAIISSTGLLTANIFLPPLISMLSSKKESKKLQGLLDVFNIFSVLVFISVGVIILLFSSSLANYSGLHDQNWSTPLYILLIGQFFNVLCGSCGYLLTMTGLHTAAAKITLLSAFVNIILNAALIPALGVSGAAIATTISLTIANMSMARVALRETGTRSFFSWGFKFQ